MMVEENEFAVCIAMPRLRLTRHVLHVLSVSYQIDEKLSILRPLTSFADVHAYAHGITNMNL